MEKNLVLIQCSCGLNIEPDNVMGTMVYCEGCDSYHVIRGNKVMDNAVLHKITRFTGGAREYRKLLLDYLYEHGEKTLFERMEVKSFKRYYVPVREIGQGNDRKFLQLNEADCSISELLFSSPVLDVSLFKDSLPEDETFNLNITDHKPIYATAPDDRIEFLSIDVPMAKLDCRYGLDSSEVVVRYLPVFILETNLCSIVCVGIDKNFVVFNEKDVLEKISKNDVPSRMQRIKDSLFQILIVLCALAIVFAAGYGLYKLFTVGMTVGLLMELLMYAIGAVVTVTGAGFMIVLLCGCFIMISSPLVFLIDMVIANVQGNSYFHPNYKNGEILMNLNS